MSASEKLGDAFVELIVKDAKFDQQLRQKAARVAQDASLIADRYNIAFGKQQVAKVDAVTAALKRQQQVANAMARSRALETMTQSRLMSGHAMLGLRREQNSERLGTLRSQLNERLKFQKELAALRGGGGGGGIGLGTVVAGSLVAGGIMQAVGSAKELVGLGFGYNAQIEQSTVSFEVLLGSLSKATRLMDEIRTYAAKTPFEMPELNKGAVSLLATKKIAANEVMPILKKLGDAAAGSSEGFAAFPRITRAVSQMLTKGKIQAEEMMQLSEAGVPAWEALAKTMGKSTAEVQRMGQAGKLGRREILQLVEGLGRTYQGMADKQSRTFTGLASTIRDNIGKAAGDASKPLFNFAKDGMGKLIAAMDSPKFQKFIDTIAGGLESAIQYGKELVDSPLAQAVVKFSAIALGVGAVVGGVSLLGGVVAGAFAYAPLAAFAAGVAAIAKLTERAFSGPEAEKFGAMWERAKVLTVEIGRNLSDLLLPLLERAGFFMDAAFGAEGSYQTSFNSFLEWALGGLNEMLDVVSLLTTDWDTTMEIMGTSWDLMIVRLGDAIENFFKNTIPNLAKSAVDGLTGDSEFKKGLLSGIMGASGAGTIVDMAHNAPNPAGIPAESPEAATLRLKLDELMDRAVGLRDEKRYERDTQENRRLMDDMFRDRKRNPLDDPFSDESLQKARESKIEKLMEPLLGFAEGMGMFAGMPSPQDRKDTTSHFVGLTDFGKRIQESLGRDTKEKREERKMKLAEEQNKKLELIRKAGEDTVGGLNAMASALKSSFGFDD